MNESRSSAAPYPSRAPQPAQPARASSDASEVSARASSAGPSFGLQQRQYHTRGNAEHQDRHGDDQRAGPRQVLPILVGAQGELEDDDREVRHGSIEVSAPKLIVERGEQQRRGLSADARDCQQQA